VIFYGPFVIKWQKSIRRKSSSWKQVWVFCTDNFALKLEQLDLYIRNENDCVKK
jgi:hypothetical protein